MVNDMVERVARALQEYATREGFDFTHGVDDGLEACRGLVGATITAMREPVSKEMILAAETAIENHKDSDWDSGPDGESYNSYEYFTPGVELAVWQAMIDAAKE